MQLVHYVIIFVVLIILFLAVTRANKKDFKLEINKLVDYLGGKEDVSQNPPLQAAVAADALQAHTG